MLVLTHGPGANHHVEWPETRRRLVLMTHNGPHVAPVVATQHQLLLELLLLKLVKLVRLHHGP